MIPRPQSPDRQFWFKRNPKLDMRRILPISAQTIVVTGKMIPANLGQILPHMNRFVTRLERKLYRYQRRPGLVRRVSICAGEAIPNAAEFGSPGTMIDAWLMLYGSGPQQLTLLTVENRLTSGSHPRLPRPKAVKPFEGNLGLRGRGTAIMRECSDAMVIMVEPDEWIRTILFFSPRPGE